MEDAWNAWTSCHCSAGGMTQPDSQAPNVFQPPNMPTPRAPQDSAGTQPSAPLSAQQSDPISGQQSAPMGLGWNDTSRPRRRLLLVPPLGTPESDASACRTLQQSSSAPSLPRQPASAPQAPIGAPEFTYNPTSPSMQAESILARAPWFSQPRPVPHRSFRHDSRVGLVKHGNQARTRRRSLKAPTSRH